ncbi:AAA family ATPase [Fructilactobacillus cliffordii]|uniref:ATP-binding protein n=1 Tax=Fructilactobacillus cliffordii TaxID=2940299 RepID=UPI0020922536|nr:AAA family ATPase [Fructilactobacillus cliffordii]USS86764.1 AAA family ATPase [Fructilactobacillus cliffordii]
MKIDTIDVYNYGKLHHLHLQFTDLQVIYGNNEAGKTTLINFILDILFGFKNRQANHPYAPKDKSQMGGKLTVSTSSERLVIERVEGKKGGDLSLFDAQGNSVANERLQQLLGPINRDVYNKLFYFDASAVETIQKLTTTELEERIRRIGVVGINQWLGLEKEIKSETDDLYKLRGKKPELNQKLKEYDELSQEIQRAQMQYTEYLELTQQIVQGQTEVKKLQQQEATTQKELQKTYKDQQDWSEYQELQQLDQQDLTPKPGYTQADLDQLQRLQTEIDFLKQNVAKGREQVQKAQQRTVPNHYQFYLQHQHQIDNLSDQLAQAQDQWQQQRNLQGQLDSETSRLHDDELETGGATAQPFTDADYQRVEQLLQQQTMLQNAEQVPTRQANATPSHLPIILMILGAGLLCLGVVLGKSLLIVLGLVGLLLLGYGGYLQWQAGSQSSATHQDEKNAGQLQRIADQLQQLGEQYHISGVNQSLWLTTLQTSIKKREQQKARVLKLQQQANQLARQLTDYLQQWQFCETFLHLQEQPVAQQLSTIQKWLAGLKDERQRQDQLDQRLREDEQQLTQLEQKLQQREQQLHAELTQRKVANLKEFNAQLEQEQQHRQLNQQKQRLQQKFTPALVSRLQQFSTKAELEGQVQRLENQLQQIQTQLSKVVQTTTVQKTQLQQISRDGTLAKLRQQQANLEAEIIDLSKQWLVLQLSFDWIERVLNEASHGRFPKVQELAQRYFAILTDQHYQQIRYQQKLEVVTKDGQRFKVAELSRGTMQQLYLALVFALTVSFSDEFPFPIIIDDGFADFDEIRTQRALELLETLSQTTQIIYFTANQSPIKEAAVKHRIEL